MNAEQAKAAVIDRPFSEGRGPIQAAWDGLATKLEQEIGAHMIEWRKGNEGFRAQAIMPSRTASPKVRMGTTRYKVAVILRAVGPITSRGAIDYSKEADRAPLRMSQVAGSIASMIDAGLAESERVTGGIVYSLNDDGMRELAKSENSA